MDKVLIVVYSHTGSSTRVARMLSTACGWPLAEVVDAKPRAGAWGNLRCVADSLLRRSPPFRYDGPDPAQFGAVVLVSPIWVGRLAGPMRSFVVRHRTVLKRVAMVQVMGESGAEGAVVEVEHLLGRPTVATMALKRQEVGGRSCVGRIKTFGKVVEAAQGEASVAPTAGLSPRAA
jgi:hypothetical protein